MDTPITEQKTDNMDAELRADILVEALPYIQEYYGQTVVVKYGGNAMINDELKDAVIHDLVLLNLVGVKLVIVHGGGPEINDMLKKIGKESKFVNGLRYTDRETMDIVQMVLCGKVNKDLVTLIEKAGGRGIGLGGMDGGLFQAKRLTDRAGTDYGYVGDIVDVDRRRSSTFFSRVTSRSFRPLRRASMTRPTTTSMPIPQRASSPLRSVRKNSSC